LLVFIIKPPGNKGAHRGLREDSKMAIKGLFANLFLNHLIPLNAFLFYIILRFMIFSRDVDDEY